MKRKLCILNILLMLLPIVSIMLRLTIAWARKWFLYISGGPSLSRWSKDQGDSPKWIESPDFFCLRTFLEKAWKSIIEEVYWPSELLFIHINKEGKRLLVIYPYFSDNNQSATTDFYEFILYQNQDIILRCNLSVFSSCKCAINCSGRIYRAATGTAAAWKRGYR